MGFQHGQQESVRETQSMERPSPGILCWNCRRLTPFEETRCQYCGAAFAGSTGGVYATSRVGEVRPPRPPEPPTKPRRTLADLVADLQRVHDVARSIEEAQPPKERRATPRESVTLFQCPSCGRFVSESAEACACGVKFATTPDSFPCPECGSHVPTLEDACPVCGVTLGDGPKMHYSCPNCGVEVASDTIRCGCGVWFED